MPFTNQSLLQFHAYEFFPNIGIGRHLKFWATAKMNDDGETWRIHVAADRVPSVDITTTTTPTLDMIDQYHKWKEDVRNFKRGENA